MPAVTFHQADDPQSFDAIALWNGWYTWTAASQEDNYPAMDNSAKLRAEMIILLGMETDLG